MKSHENNNDLINRRQVETTSHNMIVKRKMFNQRNRVITDFKVGWGGDSYAHKSPYR